MSRYKYTQTLLESYYGAIGGVRRLVMGLDASVRCRCFEEGKLKPGPVPFDDLYIDGEGYLSSRKLDDAGSRFNLRQMWARYYDLETAFEEWANHACEHEDGEICSEHVGNWSGVAAFSSWCEKIGEDKLPILNHILPPGNGGTFPAEKAEAALAELDIFDAELKARSRGAWCGTFANEALRELLNASLETGNPIRWC